MDTEGHSEVMRDTVLMVMQLQAEHEIVSFREIVPRENEFCSDHGRDNAVYEKRVVKIVNTKMNTNSDHTTVVGGVVNHHATTSCDEEEDKNLTYDGSRGVLLSILSAKQSSTQLS